jgi:hypothetical protein
MARIDIKTKLIFLILICSSCDISKLKNVYSPPKELSSNENKTLYTLGRIMGQGLKKHQFNDEEMQIIFKGIWDAQKDLKPEFNISKFEPRITEILEYKQAQKIAKNVLKSEQILKELSLKSKMLKEFEPKLLINFDPLTKKHDFTKLKLNLSTFNSSNQLIEELTNKEILLSSLPLGLQKVIRISPKGKTLETIMGHEHAYGIEGSGAIEGGELLRFQFKLLD